MAVQGVWYSVHITVNGYYGSNGPYDVGAAYLEICMWNYSVCDENTPQEPSMNLTDADAYLSEGMLEVYINDTGNYGYAVITVMDMQFIELLNSTFNTTYWNYNMTANNYTESQYLVMVSLYNTDGMSIYMGMETVGDYDEDQMIFDYYG